jgi:hypothetical protein
MATPLMREGTAAATASSASLAWRSRRHAYALDEGERLGEREQLRLVVVRKLRQPLVQQLDAPAIEQRPVRTPPRFRPKGARTTGVTSRR